MLPLRSHLGPPVRYAGAPLGRARAVALLLHGRAQDPATVEAQVAHRIALPGVAYVAPAAADRSWYPAGFMAAAADNEPALTGALELLATLADQLAAAGVPPATQIVMGFSQGACLACEHVYRRRRAGARALIAFTGGLIGPPGTAWPAEGAALAGMPAQLGGSVRDPWVPVSRMRETAAVLAQLGARVDTVFHDTEAHAISDAEIDAARGLLAGLTA